MMLSIVLPAIRVDRWERFLDSIDCTYDWELIIVTPPCTLPNKLKRSNVTHIIDRGGPTRASCIAASMAIGKYITWAADDGVFVTTVIDKCLYHLEEANTLKKVLSVKYLEACTTVHPDSYYRLNNAYPKSKYINDDWWILNCGFMNREYYNYLGGWDCQFETSALAHADLAARCQRDGADVQLIQDPLLDCTHMPGSSGDHGPIFECHTYHDDPLYAKIYRDKSCLNRIRIPLDNWKNASSTWKYRFPNG